MNIPDCICLDHYDPKKDLYSDGPIESELLELVQSGRDPLEAIARDTRWPVLYHLSPQRHDLLSFHPFCGARLLEIGAGCGGMTGLFQERFERVDAVELSLLRARITAARHGGRGNLRVLAGDYTSMPLEQNVYDCATLIGELEYAGSFFPARGGEDPALSLLARAHSHIRPGGLLIAAIENRYGIKYWAGCREDHTAQFFRGMEGYRREDKARTYSRGALESLLARAGFDRMEFYYPHPDYKLPVRIFSDDYQGLEDEISGATINYDLTRARLFDEQAALSNLAREGMLPIFANSFLVFARAAEVPSICA